MAPDPNPLLDFSGLPRFTDIKIEHIAPAIDALLFENRATLARLTNSDTPTNWESIVQPLEDSGERLTRAWAQIGHLNAVVDTPELREAYNASLPKLMAFYSDLSQNPALYAKYRTLRQSDAYGALTSAQQRVIDNELRDFRLGGAELPDADKARFKLIREELARLATKFEENVLDATNRFGKYVEDETDLVGVPEDVIVAARAAAETDGRPGWKLTLHAPCYMPVMQYAYSRALRERMYHAYATRASDQGDMQFDNTTVIKQILELRAEQAMLLGYRNYAELSLVPKMARSPQQVLDFLRELAAKAKPYARRDISELRSFAAKELQQADLQAWDIPYASEKLRADRYAFSAHEVKQYFPEDRVLAGMFKVVASIFCIEVREGAAPRWHDDVRFFEILDRSGSRIGQFYLDLYARAHKRGGAWMDAAINRRRTAQGIQTPVSYLTCNFSAPVNGKPALFSHDEVQTLFHEFGHGLHQLLTQVDYLGVSGLNGVEWDAVELPSQFMENFCWEWDVLKDMTGHVATGEPLPRALFGKMLAAKNFQSGMQMVRQLEFALFDLLLHSEFDPHGDHGWLDLLEQVRAEVAVVSYPAYNRFTHAFSHIFAGGYAAGYYSYKWAEVLAADAYSLFEQMGVLSPVAGEQFRREVLARGGSRPALESFVAFRGRPPTIEPLLRHSGMDA
jgi:oligopeptidase A